MRIRTDFVTNSSSSCTAEVRIDNPVLLELVKEYGVAFDLNNWDAQWALGYIQKLPRRKKREWAVWIKAPFENYRIPATLSDVLLMLLEAIEQESLIQNFGSFKDAVLQHRREIECNYVEVLWSTNQVTWGSEIDINEVDALIERNPEHEYDAYEDVLSVKHTLSYSPDTGEKTEKYSEFL